MSDHHHHHRWHRHTHFLALFIILIFVVSLIFIEQTHAISRNDFPETKSFTTTGQPNLQNIKATSVLRESKSRGIKCEFRFSTVDCEDVRANLKQQEQKEQLKQQQQQEKSVSPKDNFSKLQLLNKECFTKKDDYWTYKICVGDDITQSHGTADTYTLGKYASTDKSVQVYDEGTACETNQQQHAGKKRRTTVKFMCGKSAGIISISEPEVCVYTATVTHPSLCGQDSSFEVYSGSVRDLSTQVAQSPLDYWMLSVEKTSSGEYLCTLKSVLRDLKTKLSTCFSEFSLATYSVTYNEEDGSETEQAQHLTSVVAKQENRKPLLKSQMLRIPGGVKSNESKFPGFLEYLHIRTSKKK